MSPSLPLKPLYLLMGPAGAGKSLQGHLLEAGEGLDYLSWGQISREIENGEGLDREHSELVNRVHRGEASFPDGFVAGILEKELLRLSELSYVNGVVMDGFPRHVSEIPDLLRIAESAHFRLEGLIYFKVSYRTVAKRIKDRRYCSMCGRFYSDFLRPRRADYKCDVEGSFLLRRRLDDLEGSRERFQKYLEDSFETVVALGKFVRFRCEIDADRDPYAVFADIASTIRIRNRASPTCIAVNRDSGQDILTINYREEPHYAEYEVLKKGEVEGARRVPLSVFVSSDEPERPEERDGHFSCPSDPRLLIEPQERGIVIRATGGYSGFMVGEILRDLGVESVVLDSRTVGCAKELRLAGVALEEDEALVPALV